MLMLNAEEVVDLALELRKIDGVTCFINKASWPYLWVTITYTDMETEEDDYIDIGMPMTSKQDAVQEFEQDFNYIHPNNSAEAERVLARVWNVLHWWATPRTAHSISDPQCLGIWE